MRIRTTLAILALLIALLVLSTSTLATPASAHYSNVQSDHKAASVVVRRHVKPRLVRGTRTHISVHDITGRVIRTHIAPKFIN